jgi:hypothetical protein
MVFKYFVIAFALIQTSVFAYRPSYDVLFKNNGNPIYTGETTSADIVVKDLSSNNSYKLKLQFSKFQKRAYFMQALYDQSFNSQDVLRVSRVAGVETLSMGKSSNPLVHVFYGLMEMYLANNNEILMNGFKQLGINFQNTQASINKEQQKLLQEYLYFSRKKARSKASERENPLRSSDPAKQAILNNILKQSFYTNNQKAKLVRVNNRFLWAIEEKSIKAYFDQNSRKLVTLELPEYNTLAATPVDLQIFGNFYSAPKRIMIEETGVPKFEVTIQTIANFRENMDMFQGRAASLQKAAAGQSTEKKSLLAQFPNFILQ